MPARVAEVLDREKAAGLQELSGYTEFADRVATVRRDLLRFLIEAAERGKTVVGYGAPGKGNTLLNHCGIRPDLLAYTVDRNPYKHGRFTPGTRIPILPPEQHRRRPARLRAVLPWNLRARADRAARPTSHDWGGRLVFPIPARTSSHCRGRARRGGLVKVVLFCGGYGMRMRNGHLRRPAQADGAWSAPAR